MAPAGHDSPSSSSPSFLGVYQHWQALQFALFSEGFAAIVEACDAEAFVIQHFEKAFRDLAALEALQRRLVVIAEAADRSEAFFTIVEGNGLETTTTSAEADERSEKSVAVVYAHRYAAAKAIAQFETDESAYRRAIEKSYAHSCWPLQKVASRAATMAAEERAARRAFVADFARRLAATCGDEEEEGQGAFGGMAKRPTPDSNAAVPRTPTPPPTRPPAQEAATPPLHPLRPASASSSAAPRPQRDHLSSSYPINNTTGAVAFAAAPPPPKTAPYGSARRHSSSSVTQSNYFPISAASSSAHLPPQPQPPATPHQRTQIVIAAERDEALCRSHIENEGLRGAAALLRQWRQPPTATKQRSPSEEEEAERARFPPLVMYAYRDYNGDNDGGRKGGTADTDAADVAHVFVAAADGFSSYSTKRKAPPTTASDARPAAERTLSSSPSGGDASNAAATAMPQPHPPRPKGGRAADGHGYGGVSASFGLLRPVASLLPNPQFGE